MLHQKLLDILIIGESKIDNTYSDAIFDVNGYRFYTGTIAPPEEEASWPMSAVKFHLDDYRGPNPTR